MTISRTMLTPRAAGRGRAFALGGANTMSRMCLVVVCVLLCCLVLAPAVEAASRYTRDKVKSSPTDADSGSKAVVINGKPSIQQGDGATPADGGRLVLGATAIKSPADFNECVRVTLAQSPILTKSAIEIESKRLDVGDAYSQYIPTLVLNTTFYLRLPEYRDSSNANRKFYDLNFSTGTWNPLLTVFEVQARKELVKIAVLAHLKVIDQGLKRLAATFLQLGMVESLINLAREKEDLASKNLEYMKTRAGLGQGAQLEVRIAQGKINMAKAECNKMRTNRAVLMDELKFIMGIPFIQKVTLDLKDYEKQVLEDFNPVNIPEEKIRQHSFDLRIKNYERALQKKNIALSYVHFMPTFSMGFTSVSALDSNTYKEESSSILPFLYPKLDFNLPLDWWTKSRDVSRQYKKLSQLNVETHNLEFKVMSEYQQSLAKLRAVSSDLKFAEANAEVQALQVQQAQLQFESGQAEYDAIVRAMGDYLESRQRLLQKRQDRNMAMLELRCLSGDFQDRFINVTVMENL